MNKKTKFILASFFTVFLFFTALSFSAQAEGLVPKECAEGTAENCGLCSFISVFVLASNLIVGLTGVASLVMFIWGGMEMITAYGNEARAKAGKEVITAAITGIVIIFLAWTVINLLVTSLAKGKADSWFDCSQALDSAK
ncbi:MAG: pilin [bacterium]